MQPTMGPVLFNTRNLESLVPGLRITSNNAPTPPRKTIASAVLAYMNKTKVSQSFFTERKLVITCVITQNTRVLLDNAFDVLWPIISGLEGALVLTEGGQQRQYTATWSDFNMRQIKGGFAEFDIIFSLL